MTRSYMFLQGPRGLTGPPGGPGAPGPRVSIKYQYELEYIISLTERDLGAPDVKAWIKL